MHRKSNDERIDFFLTATDWSGDVTNAEPDKCDDLSWFAVSALPANTVPYIKQALQNVLAERPFDTHGWGNSCLRRFKDALWQLAREPGATPTT